MFTTVFPHAGQPGAGLFVRERMRRVAAQVPVVVVAPVPWFPVQGLIQKWRPHFRPDAPRHEVQAGLEVYHPRFFSVPGFLKALDGWFLAISTLPLLLRLRKQFRFNVIDAHFAYPDGDAATRLGRWLKIPTTITLRGTEARLVRSRMIRSRIRTALRRAERLFSVSGSLKRLAMNLGIPDRKIEVVPNGVDTAKFAPVSREEARRMLDIPCDAPVLISVGGLVERKGFHRVLDVLPALRDRFPGLLYLIVGGASPEGDWTGRLKQQVRELGLSRSVRFLGTMPAEELRVPLSAADLFVLATRNEGWANVLMEAMACGLPVVTTDVGGNREVVCRPELGRIIPFGESGMLKEAIENGLSHTWNRDEIVAYARANSWDQTVATLVGEFEHLVRTPPARGTALSGFESKA